MLITVRLLACREVIHKASVTVQPMAALTPYIPHQARSRHSFSSKFKCNASTLRFAQLKETFSIQNWPVEAASSLIASFRAMETNTPTQCKSSLSCRRTKANRGRIPELMNRPVTVSSLNIQAGKTPKARLFHRPVTVFPTSVALTKLSTWALQWSTLT